MSFADFACALADAARAETLTDRARTIEDKGGAGGFDPVTDADRAAERAMRALIEAEHPDHGIAGEEYAEHVGAGRYVWSLDPIDGTRSFMCGLPTWTTLIALLDGGRPAVGLIDAPRLGERYLGDESSSRLIRDGGGSVALAVSDCRRIAEARLATTDPYLFAGAEREAFERVRGAARTTRYGHDAYAYARLAAGSIDLVIEAGLKPYDYDALIPVVRGAGGVTGDWPVGYDFKPGRIVAAATRELFEEAIEALSHK